MQNKLLVHLQLSLEGKGCSWKKNFKFYLKFKGFNSLHAGRFLCLLSSAYFFFKIFFFEKDISEKPSECQTVRIQIRPNILSGLNWVQSVLYRLSADETSEES